MSEFQIGYEDIAALGGLPAGNRDVSPSVNAFWRNESFHNNGDYAASESFHQSLSRLRKLGRAQRCAIMCAEAVSWRCHRRIIADYLIAAGETVFHILEKGNAEPARMTAAAERGPSGRLTYPAGPTFEGPSNNGQT
jgi:uncharacterized protein (DUF488 family)